MRNTIKKTLTFVIIKLSPCLSNLGGRTYLVGEVVILVGDQEDGEKNRQIFTPVSAFSAIVSVSFKCVL